MPEILMDLPLGILKWGHDDSSTNVPKSYSRRKMNAPTQCKTMGNSGNCSIWECGPSKAAAATLLSETVAMGIQAQSCQKF